MMAKIVSYRIVILVMSNYIVNGYMTGRTIYGSYVVD